MENRRRPETRRWAKVAFSAAAVPALLLGLLALERTDPGTPAVIASESLDPIGHRSFQLGNVFSGSGSFGVDLSRFGFNRTTPSMPSMFPAVPGRNSPLTPGGGQDATAGAEIAATEASANAALSQAARANVNNPGCGRITRQLRATIDRLEELNDRLGPIPGFDRLIDRLEDQIGRIQDLCDRLPSGFIQFPSGRH